MGAKDLAHPACTDLGGDLVDAELAAWFQSHVGKGIIAGWGEGIAEAGELVSSRSAPTHQNPGPSSKYALLGFGICCLLYLNWVMEPESRAMLVNGQVYRRGRRGTVGPQSAARKPTFR